MSTPEGTVNEALSSNGEAKIEVGAGPVDAVVGDLEPDEHVVTVGVVGPGARPTCRPSA